MIKKFIPNEYIENFEKLDIKALKDKGIKLIICDVDNTLVAHDEPKADGRVETFIEKVKSNGLQICLISNNNKKRVSLFAQGLDIHYYSFAKKPLPSTYRKVKKDYGLKGNQIAAVGDQLLTDVFGGNLQGIYTVLTHPLKQKDLNGTKINRKIENRIFKSMEKKGILKKGVFDE